MNRAFLSIALVLTLALSLVMSGCGAEEANVEKNQTETAQGADGEKIQPQDEGLRLSQEKNVEKDSFLEEPSFAGFLSKAEAGFIVPGLKQHVIPQGIAADLEKGLAYISNYYQAPSIPSVISAVDLAGGDLKAEYRIYQPDGSPFTSHMGGIGLTERKIYVSDNKDEEGNACLAEISLDKLPTEGSHDVTVERRIPVPVQPSFINYSQGILWIGNFYHPDGDYELPPEIGKTVETADGEYGCYILGYELDDSGALPQPEEGKFPRAKLVIAAPDKIQGISLTEDSIYLSRSYGRKADSSLLKYSLSLDEDCDSTLEICGQTLPAYILDRERLVEETVLMPMSEGVCLGKDETLIILFESGAEKYKDGRDRTDTVWMYDISEG